MVPVPLDGGTGPLTVSGRFRLGSEFDQFQAGFGRAGLGAKSARGQPTYNKKKSEFVKISFDSVFFSSLFGGAAYLIVFKLCSIRHTLSKSSSGEQRVKIRIFDLGLPKCGYLIPIDLEKNYNFDM